MSFGEVFKDLRMSHGLSQNTVAEIFFVERATVGKWERGLNYPNQNVLLNIADYFNVSLDYLFERKCTNFAPKSKLEIMYEQLTAHQQDLIMERMQAFIDTNREYNKQKQVLSTPVVFVPTSKKSDEEY